MGEEKKTIRDYRQIIFDLRRESWTTFDIGAEINYEASSVRRFLLQEVDAPLLPRRAISRKVLAKHQKVYDYLDEGLEVDEIDMKMALEGDSYTRQWIIQLKRKREEKG